MRHSAAELVEREPALHQAAFGVEDVDDESRADPQARIGWSAPARVVHVLRDGSDSHLLAGGELKPDRGARARDSPRARIGAAGPDLWLSLLEEVDRIRSVELDEAAWWIEDPELVRRRGEGVLGGSI